MFKLVVIASVTLMASLSSAFAVGNRSTAFYNSHNYTVGPNGGPAKVTPKYGVRRNPANRVLNR
jgi:hypothetical protein